MLKIACIIILQVLLYYAYEDDKWMHPHFVKTTRTRRSLSSARENESLQNFWFESALNAVEQRLAKKNNENIARNVILFLGDGMSIPTLSATRVYMGGEEKKLSFDDFPYTGLSKTYCVDNQVADSACSATAYLTGIKGNLGTIGVTSAVQRGDCNAMSNTTFHSYSIAHYAQLLHKRTGIVTTTRVTHASPAGVYAHTAERDWESDSDIIKQNFDPNQCTDIARQLIFGATGRKLDVILGGGRANFLPENELDENGTVGRRQDGLNLIKAWENTNKRYNAKYVSDREQLLKVDKNTEKLLGLFNTDHINYNLDRNRKKEPSLKEMTKAAIKILQRGAEGFFLFVEGGRIDMGHHETRAHKALDETREFSEAIQAAMELTNSADTLIVVTSDHSHTMSFSGYAERGESIWGIGGKASDQLPYSILNYANGPGYKDKRENGERYNIEEDNLNDVNYQFPGISPMASETHGGDDVAVFAKGPWAHLFTGVMEQHVIPHLMSFASCVGRGLKACDNLKEVYF